MNDGNEVISPDEALRRLAGALLEKFHHATGLSPLMAIYPPMVAGYAVSSAANVSLTLTHGFQYSAGAVSLFALLVLFCFGHAETLKAASAEWTKSLYLSHSARALAERPKVVMRSTGIAICVGLAICLCVVPPAAERQLPFLIQFALYFHMAACMWYVYATAADLPRPGDGDRRLVANPAS